MRPETKQLLKNISIGFGIFLLVGLVLYGVWSVTRAEFVTISTVEVSGGETISHDQVRTAVEQLLEGEYAGFIPRRFTWTYPESEIVAVVQATPRVSHPSVERTGKVVQVRFAEYEPVALWCGATAVYDCVFLDSVGYGFAVAPSLTGGAFIRYINVGHAAVPGEVFTEVADFTQLQELTARLSDVGWSVIQIELDQARDAFVRLAGGSELKISLTYSPQQIVDNLQTVLRSEKYADLEPGNFTYIDLRFGNKVFVNEFGDPEAHASSTESGVGEMATSTASSSQE